MLEKIMTSFLTFAVKLLRPSKFHTLESLMNSVDPSVNHLHSSNLEEEMLEKEKNLEPKENHPELKVLLLPKKMLQPKQEDFKIRMLLQPKLMMLPPKLILKPQKLMLPKLKPLSLIKLNGFLIFTSNQTQELLPSSLLTQSLLFKMPLFLPQLME